MNAVRTIIRAAWLAVLLPGLAWAQETDVAPVGEAVERHLSLDGPVIEWVQDPGRVEEEIGDTIETRETLKDTLETIKLSGLVPPVRFESGVADIPDTTVESLADILARMTERSDAQEVEMRRLRALIEHIPVPLLTLHADNAVTLQNNAARRLFGAEHVTTLRDLRKFGFGFAESVDTAVPGMRQLVTFEVEGIEYHLTLAATELGWKAERGIDEMCADHWRWQNGNPEGYGR